MLDICLSAYGNARNLAFRKHQTKKVIAGRKALAPPSVASAGKARSQPLDPAGLGKTKGTGTSVTVVKRIVKVSRPSPSTTSSRASSAEIPAATKISAPNQSVKPETKAKSKPKAKDAAQVKKASRKDTSSQEISRGGPVPKPTTSTNTTTVATKDSSTSSEAAKKTTAKATTKATTKRIRKAKAD